MFGSPIEKIAQPPVNVAAAASSQAKPAPRQQSRAYMKPAFHWLVRGTLIRMGNRAERCIEELRPGDQVLSYDYHRWKFLHSTVVLVKSHEPYAPQPMVMINGHVMADPSQAVYAADEQQYLPALALRLGQPLRTVSECNLGIRKLEVLLTRAPMYQLLLGDGTHNYFANDILMWNGVDADEGVGGIKSWGI